MVKSETIILAALLHDIGKFSQIAGQKLNEKTQNQIHIICPEYKEKSSHIHALYSSELIEDYLQFNDTDLTELVKYHHSPEKIRSDLIYEETIVALADWLSNGAYRLVENSISNEYINKPIISIFSKIRLDGKQDQNKFIAPAKLELNLEALFPEEREQKAIEQAKINLKDENPFQKLFTDFNDELQGINFKVDFKKSYSQLLHLLEKYTITVPSFFNTGKQYITLFHHLRITAMIASCLLKQQKETIMTISEAISKNNLDHKILSQPLFYLIGCDISGIQDFIYSVTSKHALKGLRGRSFYLQMLSEYIAKSIIHNFDISIDHILFIGGGNLYLLFPEMENMNDMLNEIKKNIDLNLLKAHRGKLALAFAYEELSANDFLNNRFGEKFKQLKRKIAIEKRRKFSTILSDEEGREEALGPFDEGGDRNVCEICSNELSIEEQDKTNNQNIKQCNFCQSFSELARNLAEGKVFKESLKKKTEKYPENYMDVFNQMGFKFELIKEKNNGYLINDTDFISDSKQYEGFKFIPVHAPMKEDGSIKMLEDFADEAEGLNTWGVLRVDVDNLGTLFSKGLGKNQTITDISMLSYFVSLFFSSHVEYITKSETDKIYIIYSGGDDMFALGSWSELPKFAQKIYQDFRKYTGNNQDITLSAGIFVSPSEKFPVYQAADSAGDSLEMAKTDNKNKITFLGQAIEWADFKEVENVKNMIVDLLKETDSKNKVPRSLLQILYAGWSEKERHEKEKKKGAVSIFRIWRLLYAFKRFKERHKERNEDLLKLEKKVVTEFTLRSHLDVATRWAEFLTR